MFICRVDPLIFNIRRGLIRVLICSFFVYIGGLFCLKKLMTSNFFVNWPKSRALTTLPLDRSAYMFYKSLI